MKGPALSRLTAAALLLASSSASGAAEPTTRPRLAVVVSVDLFRADALPRWEDLFLPARDENGRVGGFRWLMSEGAWFVDARFTHVPNETAPGHAVLLTGAEPYASGMVGNRWIDRATGRAVYCVADPRGTPVEADADDGAVSVGPVHLLVSTVGDELEMATAGRARSASIALKDRAAILMAGHAADLVLWLDPGRLRWTSSRAFVPRGGLPDWVSSPPVTAPLRDVAGRVWEPLPETVRAREEGRTRSLVLPGWKGPYGMGAEFPHRVREGEGAAKDALRTPWGNDAVFAAAKAAVRAMEMGKDEVPDLLTLGLSAGDWIGHAWGPHSPESLDALLRVDRGLADFLRFLETEVPGGLDGVVLAVTGDHGIADPPEDLATFGFDARRVAVGHLVDAAEEALDRTWGEGRWIAAYHHPTLWFTAEALARAPSREALEATAARAVAAVPGVHAVFTRSAILEGRLPYTPVARAVSLGFHPSRSGDLVVVMDPAALLDVDGDAVSPEDPYPADHAQPWAHDAHVPVLMGGFGVAAGVRTGRVSPGSIAPTLSRLLGIARPSGSDAPLLF